MLLVLCLKKLDTAAKKVFEVRLSSRESPQVLIEFVDKQIKILELSELRVSSSISYKKSVGSSLTGVKLTKSYNLLLSSIANDVSKINIETYICTFRYLSALRTFLKTSSNILNITLVLFHEYFIPFKSTSLFCQNQSGSQQQTVLR